MCHYGSRIICQFLIWLASEQAQGFHDGSERQYSWKQSVLGDLFDIADPDNQSVLFISFDKYLVTLYSKVLYIKIEAIDNMNNERYLYSIY